VKAESVAWNLEALRGKPATSPLTRILTPSLKKHLTGLTHQFFFQCIAQLTDSKHFLTRITCISADHLLDLRIRSLARVIKGLLRRGSGTVCHPFKRLDCLLLVKEPSRSALTTIQLLPHLTLHSIKSSNMSSPSRAGTINVPCENKLIKIEQCKDSPQNTWNGSQFDTDRYHDGSLVYRRVAHALKISQAEHPDIHMTLTQASASRGRRVVLSTQKTSVKGRGVFCSQRTPVRKQFRACLIDMSLDRWVVRNGHRRNAV